MNKLKPQRHSIVKFPGCLEQVCGDQETVLSGASSLGSDVTWGYFIVLREVGGGPRRVRGNLRGIFAKDSRAYSHYG